MIRVRYSSSWRPSRLQTVCAGASVVVMLMMTPGLAAKTVKTPSVGSPEAVVQSALRAALLEDEKAGFDAYLGLVDPELTTTDEAVRQLRSFTWGRFRSQAARYIIRGTSIHFEITRQDPQRMTPETERVRLFVKPQTARGPNRPMRLRRVGDAWLIEANAL